MLNKYLCNILSDLMSLIPLLLFSNIYLHELEGNQSDIRVKNIVIKCDRRQLNRGHQDGSDIQSPSNHVCLHKRTHAATL